MPAFSGAQLELTAHSSMYPLAHDPGLSLSPASASRAPHKRRAKQGRVVNALREHQRISHGQVSHPSTLDIGPSSSGSVLSSYALQAALNSHLVTAALDAMQSMSDASWSNLASSLTDLRLGCSADDDAFKGALCAVAASLGARISMHSSITGVTREEIERGIVDEASLGRRREGACVALARRAVVLSNEGRLLERDNPRGRALAVLIRSAFACLAPAHSDAREDLISLGTQLEANTRTHAPGSSMLRYHDAIIAYNVRAKPLCADGEVQLPTTAELASLRCERSLGDVVRVWSDIGFATFTTLSRLQLSTLLPLTELQPTFVELFQAADVCISLLPTLKLALSALAHAARELVVVRFTAQLEVAIYEQATHHLRGRSRTLWSAAQVRLVQHVALFVRIFPECEPSPTTTHLIANHLMVFQTVPEWTELVVEAAVEHAKGEGSLARAGLTLLDLSPLHDALRKGAAVFAALAEKERDFVDALHQHALGTDYTTKMASWADTDERRAEAGAELMVHRALSDILSY